ncbi:ubiquitin-related modifier 1 isoform X3 [Pseudorasbora parva]|uniref:ubiquitin-related modifier 1 isoform X3 n=1 Tax=Pseudorasbora parva TaxID=51549 RepID=UPI00351F70D4
MCAILSGLCSNMAAPLGLHLEFGGGAELLFDGVKNHHVTLPGQSDPWDMKQLLAWIRGNMLKERPELFMQGNTVVNWNTSFMTRITLSLSLLFTEAS